MMIAMRIRDDVPAVKECNLGGRKGGWRILIGKEDGDQDGGRMKEGKERRMGQIKVESYHITHA